jgi:hypothetical protein
MFVSERHTARTAPAIIMSALLALACVLALLATSGCGDKRSVIEDGLRNDVAAIKRGDTALMEQYFGFNPAQGFADVGIGDEEFAALFFKNFTLEIESVEIHDKTKATVVANVTSSDYEKALASWRSTVTNWLSSNGPMTGADNAAVRKQAAMLYLQALASADIAPTQSSVTLEYELDGKVWILQNASVLADAVFGNAFTGFDANAVATDTGVGATSAQTSS